VHYINSRQQSTNVKSKTKKASLQSLPKKAQSQKQHACLPVERSTRQGQREKRRALHILSVAAASRSSLLKKIVGRRVND